MRAQVWVRIPMGMSAKFKSMLLEVRPSSSPSLTFHVVICICCPPHLLCIPVLASALNSVAWLSYMGPLGCPHQGSQILKNPTCPVGPFTTSCSASFSLGLKQPTQLPVGSPTAW